MQTFSIIATKIVFHVSFESVYFTFDKQHTKEHVVYSFEGQDIEMETRKNIADMFEIWKKL